VTSANAGVDHIGCPALLTDLLTRVLDGLGEDVSDACRVLAEDVGVDAQRHRGVSVAETSGYHVHRYPGQEQGGRVQVTQIMQPGMRQRLGRGE
jgi:hypothetical protein